MAFQKHKKYKTLADKVGVLVQKTKLVILFILLAVLIATIYNRIWVWNYIKTYFY